MIQDRRLSSAAQAVSSSATHRGRQSQVPGNGPGCGTGRSRLGLVGHVRCAVELGVVRGSAVRQRAAIVQCKRKWVEALNRSCGVRLRAAGGYCRHIPFNRHQRTRSWINKAELWCLFTSTRRRLQTQADKVRLNALAVQPHAACRSLNEGVTQLQEPWTLGEGCAGRS